MGWSTEEAKEVPDREREHHGQRLRGSTVCVHTSTAHEQRLSDSEISECIEVAGHGKLATIRSLDLMLWTMKSL